MFEGKPLNHHPPCRQLPECCLFPSHDTSVPCCSPLFTWVHLLQLWPLASYSLSFAIFLWLETCPTARGGSCCGAGALLWGSGVPAPSQMGRAACHMCRVCHNGWHDVSQEFIVPLHLHSPLPLAHNFRQASTTSPKFSFEIHSSKP